MSTSTLHGDESPSDQTSYALPNGAVTAAGTSSRAVERAIALLCAFSREMPALGVTELAERLDLTKSTVHRLLQVLMSHGFVAQDPSRRQYTLGYRILALARSVPGDAELRSICQPHMRSLREATQETVTLYGAAGDVRVCLEEFESPQLLRMAAGLGRCFPLDRGSASYALLIDGPDTEQWRHMTSQLPAEREAKLRDTVAAARERGYAMTRGETVAGAASIAAPIRGADGMVLAALSVGGPAPRFTDAAITSHTAALLATVALIQRDLSAAWVQWNAAPIAGTRVKGGGDGHP